MHYLCDNYTPRPRSFVHCIVEFKTSTIKHITDIDGVSNEEFLIIFSVTTYSVTIASPFISYVDRLRVSFGVTDNVLWCFVLELVLVGSVIGQIKSVDSSWQLIIENNGVVKVDTTDWSPDHRQANNASATEVLWMYCMRHRWRSADIETWLVSDFYFYFLTKVNFYVDTFINSRFKVKRTIPYRAREFIFYLVFR